MILWSFWVDPWEHPFNTWNRFYSVLIPLASVEPDLIAIDPLPPKEHVDFGPWKGPLPGPIKPGIPTPPQELKKWDFSIGFKVNQGIPSDLTWESHSKQPSKEEQAAFEWREKLKWWSKNPPQTSRSPEEAQYDSEMRWQQQQEQEYQKHRIGRWTDETVPQIVRYI